MGFGDLGVGDFGVSGFCVIVHFIYRSARYFAKLKYLNSFPYLYSPQPRLDKTRQSGVMISLVLTQGETDQSGDRNHKHNSIFPPPPCSMSKHRSKKSHHFREILMGDLIFARFQPQLANRNKFHAKPRDGANLNY